MRITLCCLLCCCLACADQATPAPEAPAAPAAAPAEPEITQLDVPANFRPFGFTDDSTLWGIQRGRLASFRLGSGRVQGTTHSAWSVVTRAGHVSWRNELGIWDMETGEQPHRLAPTELIPGYDGPPDVTWSPAGDRGVLSWAAEWDFHNELIENGDERTALGTALDGYMLDRPVLWLDQHRVLFEIVANAPRGGEPEYAESGWRGDLAVLELGDSTRFRRVTDAADGVWLRAAGLLHDSLLVREYDRTGVRTHWLYDPTDWSRRELDLPRGRSYAAGRAVVIYVPATGDTWKVWLWSDGAVRELGTAADPDLRPAAAAAGTRIALRTLRGGQPVLTLIQVPPVR